MFKVAFFAPIAAGKTEQARQFPKEWLGARKQEHADSRRKFGITQETTWLQQTPQGDFMIIYSECESRDKMFKGFMSSQDPYDVWFRQQVSEIMGFDMSANDEEDDGPNPNFVDWQDGTDFAGTTRYGFFAPILPGKLDQWKKFSASMKSDRLAEHDASRRKFGVKSEQAWLQQTPHGDFVVIVMQGKNPPQSIQDMAKSDDAYDKWFMGQAKEIHGIDFSQPMPVNETLADWHAQPVAAH